MCVYEKDTERERDGLSQREKEGGEAKHNGFPMYHASAGAKEEGRGGGVKYLSLSSRDNARANWNLLRSSTGKSVAGRQGLYNARNARFALILAIHSEHARVDIILLATSALAFAARERARRGRMWSVLYRDVIRSARFITNYIARERVCTLSRR